MIHIDHKERLKRELDQLEKTYRAGIINQKEFEKGKERIEARMREVADEVQKKEEGKKIVAEILDKPEKQEKPEPKKEPQPKKEDRPKKKPVKKAAKKAPRVEEEDDYEEDNTFSKVVIFVGIVAILLLLIMVRVFTGDEAAAPKDLAGAEGTVGIDVYMDFMCEHSPATWDTLLELKRTYGNHTEVRVRHFPMSTESLDVANAIQCARDQEMHMAYIGRLFDNMDALDTESLKKYAWAEGLDVLDFHECVDEQSHLERVKSDLEEGLERGVRKTPTVFVEDEMIEGTAARQTFEEQIDGELGI